MPNKALWIAIGVIVAVVLSGVAYVLVTNNPQEQQTQLEQTNTSTTPPVNTPTDPNSEQPAAPQQGSYQEYSEESFATAEGRRVLFFHAAWCPQCRALEQSIESSAVPAGMTIFKVDYDTATDLKQKYGVTIQTTVVEVDANGELVTKYVAYDDPTLQAVLTALGR